MDKNMCVHYSEDYKQCRFKSGNCGKRRAGQVCSVDGYPQSFLRQEKKEFVLKGFEG